MNGLQRVSNDIEREVNLPRHLIGKGVLDGRVIAAIKQVSRHEFLPADVRFLANENDPAFIGSGQPISRSYIIALISDLLETKSTDFILETGTVAAPLDYLRYGDCLVISVGLPYSYQECECIERTL
ncbi:MAG: hypothetical protein ACU83U_10755 [Gammaproteobacteria bacterium]